MSVIEVHKLRKTYRRHQKEEGLLGSLKSLFKRRFEETRAVDEVSFRLEEGELVGFLGPNGAGKTTTLKMLSGILHPSGGEARVLGYTPWQRANAFRRQFALVMGNKSQLWFDIPAMDSLRLNKEIYGVSEADFRDVVGELSGLLNVEKLLEVPVRNLSLGERMKMELMASLLHRPRVLLLDEPTIGLDVVSQKAIREFLARYNRERRTTVLLTSHYMADIQALCRRVLLINRGRLEFDGSLEALASRFRRFKRVRASFESPVPASDLEALGRVVEMEGNRALLEVPESAATDAARQLLTRFPVSDLGIEETPIEDLIRDAFETKAGPAGT